MWSLMSNGQSRHRDSKVHLIRSGRIRAEGISTYYKSIERIQDVSVKQKVRFLGTKVRFALDI